MGHDLLVGKRPSLAGSSFVDEVFAAARPDAPEGLFEELLRPPAEEMVACLVRARQDENVAVFRQLRYVAGLVEAWRPSVMQREADRRTGRRDTSAESLAEASAVAEVAAALGMTEGSAARRVDAARALLLEGRMPQAAFLLQSGVLDWARVNVLVSRTQDLSVADAQRVEALVLDVRTRGLTIGRFERAVDRAVLAVDADAAERRRKAARSGRRVAFYRDADGASAASLWVSGPAEALAAVWASLDAGARHLRTSGDPRTLDQLRHDLLVTGCTRGGLPVPQALVEEAVSASAGAAVVRSRDVTGDTGEPSAESCDSGGVDTPAWFTTPRPDVAAHITVTMTWETLVGLSQAPAELDGYGAIGADLARSLAVDGVWRCVAVDGEHGTVLGVGRTTFRPGYVPGRALREFTAVAAPECAVPWCHTRGEVCDLDHRVPHAHGGSTCACNTHPLCRRHHRLKSAGYLRCAPSTDPRHPPGTCVCTTRAGRRVVAPPHAPLPADSGVPAPAAVPSVPSPAPPAERSEPMAARAGGSDDPPF